MRDTLGTVPQAATTSQSLSHSASSIDAGSTISRVKSQKKKMSASGSVASGIVRRIIRTYINEIADYFDYIILKCNLSIMDSIAGI